MPRILKDRLISIHLFKIGKGNHCNKTKKNSDKVINLDLSLISDIKHGGRKWKASNFDKNDDEVDNKSLDTLKKVSRELSGFPEEERFYWLRVIQSYDENNIEQSKSWKKLVDKTPSEVIKKLALVLHKFINLHPTSIQMQWPPGRVSE